MRVVVSLPGDIVVPDRPPRFAGVLIAVAPRFVPRSWRRAPARLIGAILAPGRRTVTRRLRLMGRRREREVANAPRGLSRAAGCLRAGARLRLGRLLAALVPTGPLGRAVDATLERRGRRRLGARGL
jgi:hypothetical protein